MDAQEFIAKVADWSQHDHRVIAACVCGSYARGDARHDSDVDFCIVAENPRLLLDDLSWIQCFGADARVSEPVEDYNLVQSIRVFYNSLEAEFGVADKVWMRLPIDRETATVINDGLKILYDPEGCLANAADFAAKMFR